MSNPFEDEHDRTFVVVNEERQHSLWRHDRVTAHRTGMRPAGQVARDGGRRAGE